ncbi:BgTH12-06938 [Blumeria graminis f. sp. triticale]|uniref:BgTH12-06938 n=1 Tax=Blumeria graminis f. sp. triticale TaxID=1689686 RepID=A0A9W4DST9_BLUGR|nr:BgTH12-06938 [Blumeria graminis f. sp. triticale]
MWINFSVTLAVSWLILQITCDDILDSDMYLPDGMNGFVCDLEFYPIEHVREVAKRGIEIFLSEKKVGKFPKTFEDTRLFNVKSDILLSWPIMSSGAFYSRNPGKVRLIMNTRGQIMGIIMITSGRQQQRFRFNKCSPVRRSLEESNEEQILLNEYWSIAYASFGYSCGMDFFPVSMVNKILGRDAKIYYEQRLSGKHKLASLKEYKGDQFSGVNLYWYPMHQKISNTLTSGPPGKFRIVFDLSNGEFKGILNIEEGKKCVLVWNLSSIPPNKIYISSSNLNLERFKSKTIWLYLEFALKHWMQTFNEIEPKVTRTKQKLIRFWQVRPEEANNDSSDHIFAIGHNIKSDTYNLYLVETQKLRMGKYEQCLQFSSHEIRRLQKFIGDRHNSDESYSPGR